ncbi:hypothetical protein BD414DRAFT_534275 [Trametes punicea]|nr:hypothetical protein BD414DRAFT_534275 [Trametes punicea]
MSSQADEIAQLLANIESNVILTYCQASAMALLAYYYLTTFKEEINHFLSPSTKFTGASLLYMLNRYTSLAFIVFAGPYWAFSNNVVWSVSCGFSPPSENQNLNLEYGGSCRAEEIFGIFLENLQYLPWAAFSGLRAYALSRNLFLAFLVFLFSLSPAVLNMVTLKWLVVFDDPSSGTCVIAKPIPTTIIRCCMALFTVSMTPNAEEPCTVTIMARLPLVLADLAVLVITWSTQYRMHRLSLSMRERPSLATVLLYDGTIYFFILTAINIAQMIIEMLSAFSSAGIDVFPSYVVVFFEPITAILVSSFLTDLRKAAASGSYQQSVSSMRTIEFRVIGPLGAPLSAPGELALAEDEEDSEFAHTSTGSGGAL